MKLEAIVLPVTDVDRTKAFYVRAGYSVDVDHDASGDFRVVQLTPPGSRCSILVGRGIAAGEPGSVQGLHLVVEDIEVARTALVAQGVDVSPPFHFGAQGRTPGPDPERRDYATLATFSDPDGNGWLLQEVGHGAQ